MKKALLLVSLFALCNLTLFAQTEKDLRVGHTERSAIHVAPQDGTTGLSTIFSNLGPSPSNLYTDWYFYVDILQFPGMAFTPAANAHVSQVQVAVERFAGPKEMWVWIFPDSAGFPGTTALAGPVLVTKMPVGGTCCGLAVADFLPFQVIAGQRYWVVVTTEFVPPGTKFVGGWYWAYQGAYPPVAFNFSSGGGWLDEPTYQEPAGEVLGTWDPTAVLCR